jgi:adenylate cyclase
LLHAAANRARIELRRGFEHYLPPALISDMLKSGDLPKLGCERRELSVVFSDIAASTTLAETVDPVDLAPLMNAYFAGVGAAIFKEGGYINEFMGDGVLAFSGRRSVSPTMPTAPSRRPCRSPHSATATAGSCRTAASRSATRVSAYMRQCHCRQYRHAVAPQIQRARLRARGSRGLNKVVATRIAVSDEILKRCQRSRFRPMGDFVVKGRRGATPVFEPVDSQRFGDDHIARYLAAYEAMHAKRPEAIDLFAELLREDPDDPCLKFHHARLNAGEKGSLIVMTEK